MITIDDLGKIELRVGQVIAVNKQETKIKCNGNEFSTKLNLNLKENAKLIIAINGNEMLIPLLKGNIPIKPDKDIEEGSKIR